MFPVLYVGKDQALCRRDILVVSDGLMWRVL